MFLQLCFLEIYVTVCVCNRLFCCCVFTKVHGIVNDTIDFVKHIISTEINSATDNPVSFTCRFCRTQHICVLETLHLGMQRSTHTISTFNLFH